MEASYLLDGRPPTRRVGSYDLIAEMGRSGMADVFLALAPSREGKRRRVTLKRLPENVDDDGDRAMFLDEARLARRLYHPNLAEVIEVGRDARSYFIVTELLDGQSLSRIRRVAQKQGTPVPPPIELRVVSDILAGLHHLHELLDDDGGPLDVVHRDVTPQQILVGYEGVVKITDFGIAMTAVRGAETRIGEVKGDLLYIAPEVLRGQTIDRRADIFAIGILLWEGATGRRFWEGCDVSAIHRRLIDGDLPTASGASAMSADLFDIIKIALELDPSRRFATARAMQQAVESVLSEQPEGSRHALSVFMQRNFIEERRRFYQSMQAAEARLDNDAREPLSIPPPVTTDIQRSGPSNGPRRKLPWQIRKPTTLPNSKPAAAISSPHEPVAAASPGPAPLRVPPSLDEDAVPTLIHEVAVLSSRPASLPLPAFPAPDPDPVETSPSPTSEPLRLSGIRSPRVRRSFAMLLAAMLGVSIVLAAWIVRRRLGSNEPPKAAAQSIESNTTAPTSAISPLPAIETAPAPATSAEAPKASSSAEPRPTIRPKPKPSLMPARRIDAPEAPSKAAPPTAEFGI